LLCNDFFLTVLVLSELNELEKMKKTNNIRQVIEGILYLDLAMKFFIYE
jgi:hypothetical protein